MPRKNIPKCIKCNINPREVPDWKLVIGISTKTSDRANMVCKECHRESIKRSAALPWNCAHGKLLGTCRVCHPSPDEGLSLGHYTGGEKSFYPYPEAVNKDKDPGITTVSETDC